MITRVLLFLTAFFITYTLKAQHNYIYSKQGDIVFNRIRMINNCLKMMNKDRSDALAVSICECRMDKIDGHFTNKQYRKHSNKANVIDLDALINEDSVFKKEFDNCFANSGKTIFLSVEGFKEESIQKCIEGIRKNATKKLDEAKLRTFCTCELELIRSKKTTDEEYKTLTDPNSVFFFEVMYKCGDPFAEKEISVKNWSVNAAKDVSGPPMDTVNVLTIDGMTYVKLKIGSMVQFWLFDTGASALLITNEMEALFKQENVITDSAYVGTGQYEMANGMVDTCRQYIINNVRIGKYYLNNILVAVSDKAKRIIVGKSLINKFSDWLLDNKNNVLVLRK